MYGSPEHEAELVELERIEGDRTEVDHPYTPCGCVSRAYGGDCAHTTSEELERSLDAAHPLILRDVEERGRLTARARQAGYGLNAEAFVDGYRHDRTSTAIAVPGPDRVAYAAGWIARQLDDRRRSHEANLDGQHDELDNAHECGACTHVDELELRAIWGDR